MKKLLYILFVQLIAAGRTEDEIKKECLENNLLGAAKEYRAKRRYAYLWNRTRMLDEELITIFMDGDLATQKIINLIAILRGDRLFFEFVYEVYREKAILGQPVLEDADVNVFFTSKGNQSELVDKWNDSTKKHLKSNYLNFMADANLLHIEKRVRYITTPILDSRLANYLDRCGEHSLLAAISGVA